jgi:hypothetical protein
VTTNDVQITVSDGASSVVSVPSTAVQVVVGCSSGGTAAINQVCAWTQPLQGQQLHGYGPLPEAGALTALASGVVLSIQIPAVSGANVVGGVVHAGPSNGPALGACVMTVTGAPFDSWFVVVAPVANSTPGTSAGGIQISLDGGRNFTPTIVLTALTTVYAVPNTGMTLNFSAATLVVGDTYRFQTAQPQWNQAGVSAAITALETSQYAVSGWGSIHIVGTCAGTDATSIESYLDTAATTYDIYTRVMLEARDVFSPTAWGGSGETEQTWINSVEASFSAVSAKRVLVGAGYYNMPSAYPLIGTIFYYRRPNTWAIAPRTVQIPAQRMASRVKDGQLANIIVNPITDPVDGFVYHDERITPSLSGNRFAACRTRIGKGQGFFLDYPNLMSPAGSDYQFFPQGSVIDVACDIVYQTALQEMDDDLLVNANGTLQSGEVLRLQQSIQDACNNNMTNVNMCSSVVVVVSPTQNVQATGIVVITVTVNGVAYVLQINATVGLS